MKLFVTGTDTEVGKTEITACLAAHARTLGSVWALKPVASGVAPGTLGEDTARIAAAAGHAPQPFVQLAAPLSPHRAAALEGRALQPDAILDWIAGYDAQTVLVEGVGGFRVPLTPDWEVADLAEALGWPVLVVVADRLGALNHTLLTLESLRARRLEIAGVVLNRLPLNKAIASNADDLLGLLDVPVILVKRIEGGATGTERARVGREIWDQFSGMRSSSSR